MAERTVGPVTTATTAAAGAVLILAWLLRLVLGVEMPAEVQGALAVVLVAAAGWFVKPRPAADEETVKALADAVLAELEAREAGGSHAAG